MEPLGGAALRRKYMSRVTPCLFFLLPVCSREPISQPPALVACGRYGPLLWNSKSNPAFLRKSPLVMAF